MATDSLEEAVGLEEPEEGSSKPFDPWPAVTSLCNGFNALLYQNFLWGTVSWRGLPVLKYPTDLWAYSEMVTADRPGVIVETGTATGGSAVFLADMMRLVGIPPDVITVDVSASDNEEDRPAQQGITYIEGSSTDPEIIERVWAMVGGRKCLVSLDSDHSESHVAAELEAYAALVQTGQHLVVEDTGWTGMAGLTGARAALDAFLKSNPRFEVDRFAERFLLTQQSGGFLRAVR